MQEENKDFFWRKGEGGIVAVFWGICWGQWNRYVAALPGKGWVGCFPELYEHGAERCCGEGAEKINLSRFWSSYYL